MHTYAFILGRNPALSVAEIISFAKKQNINLSILDVSEEVLLVEFDRELDHLKTQNELGGTIKIGKVFFSLDLDKSQDQLLDIFSSTTLFKYFFQKKEGKVHFGFSLYFLSYLLEFDRYYTKILKNLGIRIKNELKKENQSSGFVQIKERYLSSVSVVKNELLEKGAEILLVVSGDKLHVGRTVSVQEFSQYSSRDFGRPARDKKAGILPPKLAKIMINLSGIKKDGILLDPFCGSGTILTEGMILAFKNIIGSDINKYAIDDSSENLDWVKKNYPNIPNNKSKLLTSDVKNISTHIPSHTVDAIVTEPYLGPPFTRFPKDYEIKKIYQDLSNLYLEAFKEFAKILKSSGRVVFIFPAFRLGGSFIFIDILPKLEKLGFKQNETLPLEIKAKYTKFMTHRSTFLYGRGDEFVFREIIVFEYV